jgi:ketosteroid isomerase-like protein
MHPRFSAILLVLATAPLAAPASEPDVAAITSEVLATNAAMVAAGNSRDAAALFGFITADATIIQNGRLFADRAAALADVDGFYRLTTEINRVFESPRVTVLSPDAALLVSDGNVSVTLDDGRRFSGPFTVTLLFVRTSDGWRVRHGHYSSPPPAE